MEQIDIINQYLELYNLTGVPFKTWYNEFLSEEDKTTAGNTYFNLNNKLNAENRISFKQWFMDRFNDRQDKSISLMEFHTQYRQNLNEDIRKYFISYETVRRYKKNPNTNVFSDDEEEPKNTDVVAQQSIIISGGAITTVHQDDDEEEPKNTDVVAQQSIIISGGAITTVHQDDDDEDEDECDDEDDDDNTDYGYSKLSVEQQKVAKTLAKQIIQDYDMYKADKTKRKAHSKRPILKSFYILFQKNCGYESSLSQFGKLMKFIQRKEFQRDDINLSKPRTLFLEPEQQYIEMFVDEYIAERMKCDELILTFLIDDLELKISNDNRCPQSLKDRLLLLRRNVIHKFNYVLKLKYPDVKTHYGQCSTCKTNLNHTGCLRCAFLKKFKLFLIRIKKLYPNGLRGTLRSIIQEIFPNLPNKDSYDNEEEKVFSVEQLITFAENVFQNNPDLNVENNVVETSIVQPEVVDTTIVQPEVEANPNEVNVVVATPNRLDAQNPTIINHYYQNTYCIGKCCLIQ